jgi:hypothetical protein
MAMPDMGKMIGPLPLGAWMAVIGGGLGIAVYTRRQNQQAPITDPDLMPEDTGTTPGVGVGGGPGWVDLNPPPPAGGEAKPTTNEEWARQAIDRLVGDGYPPAVVNSAITKFINEQGTPSAQEYTLIQVAIRKLGSPPVPVNGPTPPVPTLPPAPKPVPSGYTNHTVQKGQTPAYIASFYRTRGANFYPIYLANIKGKKRADGTMGVLLSYADAKPGVRLVIPNAIKNQY